MNRKHPVRSALAVAVTLLAVTGCSDEATGDGPLTAVKPEPAPPVTPRPAPAQAPVPQAVPEVPASNEGRVLEVADAGGYTYLRVEHAGGSAWMASGKVAVQVGDRVRWGDAALMRGFHSKSLGRTFDEVWFVSTVLPVRPGSRPAAPATTGRGRVVSVIEAAGYSYIEVDADGRRWLAAPVTVVREGDTITWDGGSTMHGFTSRTLGRTFDEIVFVSRVAGAH